MTVPKVWAGTYEWTSGWGMGVSEYSVDDGNGNELNISCPSEDAVLNDPYISAHATIMGKSYASTETGFDVIVDGVAYENPFFTDCRACGANFPEFWKALRNANNLHMRAEGKTIRLPTKSIKKELRPLDEKGNTCKSAW
ncbi:hypothetical protein BZL41_17005 [Pseudomonas sp. PIC25]|nr:hypothetical protein BZL41_17005 [Pseudomonas sp. PIC25]